MRIKAFKTSAAKAVRDWVFTHTKLDALYSYMTAGNVASYSTAAAAGLKKVKEYEDPEDGPLYVYAITREEWKELQVSEGEQGLF